MRNHILLLSALLLIEAVAVSVSAQQQKPKVGDFISGVVYDDDGPVMCATIIERKKDWGDAVFCQADAQGRFSFPVVDPDDKIRVGYPGYEYIELPIDRMYYEIKLKKLPPEETHIMFPFKGVAGENGRFISYEVWPELIENLPGFPSPRALHYDYVDLGLSVKWATCNVGANRPEEYGDYYAWGELEPKESYTWENYRLGVGGELPFERKVSKYNTDRNRGVVDNKTTLDLVDDVANVRWGGSWRMPTLEEWTELRQNCTWTVDSINGVKGLRATSNKPGYTDRSIFLPEADYWSSSLHELAPLFALGTPIGVQKLLMLDLVKEREKGYPVRPVCP